MTLEPMSFPSLLYWSLKKEKKDQEIKRRWKRWKKREKDEEYLESLDLFLELGATVGAFLRGPELVGEPELSTKLFLDQSGQGLVGSGGVALSKRRILTSLAPGNHNRSQLLQLTDTLDEDIGNLSFTR